MKVLWFSVTPARYEKNSQEHNGGGGSLLWKGVSPCIMK